MPSLTHSLQMHDLGHLSIVAECLGVELKSTHTRQALDELVLAMLDRDLLNGVVNELPAEGQVSLNDLLQHEGRLPWSLFTRRYGPVREMGAGRRDRVRPHLAPVSASEQLWYRALVGRAFFDTPDGPEEFAYIPDDVLPFLPSGSSESGAPLGRPSVPGERAHTFPASQHVLDDACTLLAALRMELSLETIPLHLRTAAQPLSSPVLQALLTAAGLLDEHGKPFPEPARVFLEASRPEALLQLVRAWIESPSFNELELIPEIILEGEWETNPRRTRQIILDLIKPIPKSTWWSLNAFIASVRASSPDFQRPAGDYDSWFIRHRDTGEYLRGFEHWGEVDGALLRFFILGPLHWLGFVDLAGPAADEPIQAFRVSSWWAQLLTGMAPQGLPSEDRKIQAGSDARLRLHWRVPRAVRYQVARFCAWEAFDGEAYRYRLTPESLDQARRQGLKASQLLVLLRKHSTALPPALVTAVERWEAQGSQAHLEQLWVLRLNSPAMLAELRASRAARYLGEPLGPAAVIVKPGAREKVLSALAEMGYLGSAELERAIS